MRDWNQQVDDRYGANTPRAEKRGFLLVFLSPALAASPEAQQEAVADFEPDMLFLCDCPTCVFLRRNGAIMVYTSTGITAVYPGSCEDEDVIVDFVAPAGTVTRQ